MLSSLWLGLSSHTHTHTQRVTPVLRELHHQDNTASQFIALLLTPQPKDVSYCGFVLASTQRKYFYQFVKHGPGTTTLITHITKQRVATEGLRGREGWLSLFFKFIKIEKLIIFLLFQVSQGASEPSIWTLSNKFFNISLITQS